MTDRLPRLRYIEAHPVDHEGQQLFLLRDPAGYAQSGLTVGGNVVFILQFINGHSRVDDAIKAYRETFQQELGSEQLAELIDALDENLLLDNDRFKEHKAAVDQVFYDAQVRPATVVTPDQDPEELRRYLNGFFAEAGFPPGSKIRPDKNSIVGLLAPHIDYQRGGRVYGAAYGEFLSGFRGDTIVILGTNHQSSHSSAVLTRKDFDTIFGRVQVDVGLVDAMASRISGDPFAGELDHRAEHSIELAATMLSYAGLHERVKIVPILVGGFTEYIQSGLPPMASPAVKELIEVIRGVLADQPGDTALIGSVDLAHLGPQFGDQIELNDPFLKQSRDLDRASLEKIARGDAGAFLGQATEENDDRHVCGLAPTAICLAALAPVTGRVLDYDQWVSPDRNGSVSFAAVGLYRTGKKSGAEAAEGHK
jgi:MEMO1 family protein